MSTLGPQYWDDDDLRRSINAYLDLTKKYPAYVSQNISMTTDAFERWLDGEPSTPRVRQRIRDFCEQQKITLAPIKLPEPKPPVMKVPPKSGAERAPYGSKKKATTPLLDNEVVPNAGTPLLTGRFDATMGPFTKVYDTPNIPTQVTNYLDEQGSLVEPLRDESPVVPDTSVPFPARFTILRPAPHFTRTSSHLLVTKSYIYFTALLWIEMGEPAYVVLGYDAKAKEFLLANATRDSPNAIAVNKKRRFAASIGKSVAGAPLGQYAPTRENGYWVLRHDGQ